MSSIIAAIGLILLAVVLHVVSSLIHRGRLDRNAAIGIRTRATQSSDRAWVVGHRAGRLWLLAAAICGYGIGLFALVTAAAQVVGVYSPAPLVIALGGYLAVVAAVITAAVWADRAARALDPSATT